MQEFIEKDREWLENIAVCEEFSHKAFFENGLNKLDRTPTLMLSNSKEAIQEFNHKDAFIIDGWTFPTTWFVEMGGAGNGQFFSEELFDDVNKSVGVMFTKTKKNMYYQLFSKIVDTGVDYCYAIEFVGKKRLYKSQNFHKWDSSTINQIIDLDNQNKEVA